MKQENFYQKKKTMMSNICKKLIKQQINFLICESSINKYIEKFADNKEKINIFRKNRFILTEKSKESLALLIHYNLIGIPVLLEGNKGVSKTRDH